MKLTFPLFSLSVTNNIRCPTVQSTLFLFSYIEDFLAEVANWSFVLFTVTHTDNLNRERGKNQMLIVSPYRYLDPLYSYINCPPSLNLGLTSKAFCSPIKIIFVYGRTIWLSLSVR